MAITPQTNIKLLKVPLELSNKNQITFNSKQAQYEYFNSLPKLEIDECSYQRKDNIIKFPAHIDSLLEYNYCMYQNSNYGDKWFYAFITNMTYENNGTTNIYIATDVFQCWQFDLQFKESFIEREHISVEQDIPGVNLLPEGLETGEFKIGGTADLEDLEPMYIIAYSGDEVKFGSDIPAIPIKQEGYSYNGIFSSITYLLTNDEYFSALMQAMNLEDNSNHIVTVFTIPKLAVKSLLSSFNAWKILDSDFKQDAIIKDNFISTPSQLDGYTPRNQKLRTYPYLYLGFNPQNR